MKFKKLLEFIFLFTLFVLPIFAGWYEEVEVRVLDKTGSVVPNASVYIVWEVSRSAGNATTKVQTTNENGRAYFKLYNREFNPKDENRRYIVYVNYQGKIYTRDFVAGSGSMPRTIEIDAYPVVFFVRDKKGMPLSLNLLIDSSFEISSDSNGRASIILNKGEHTIKPKFFDLDQTEKFKVENVTVVNLEVNLYSLYLRVVDDNGVAIPEVKVTIGPFSSKTDSKGLVVFSNITKPFVNAEISYQKYSLNQVFNLSSGTNFTFVLDTHPPKISDITTKLIDGSLQIRAIVSDTGKYPSGFTSNKAKINLRYFPNDDVEKVLPMYLVGYNTYESIIKLESEKNIKYTIEASDSFGNTVFSSDVFVLEGSKKQSFTDEQTPPIGFFDFSKSDLSILIYPVVIGVLVGIGVYLYKYKLSKQSQQEQKKPDYHYAQKEIKEEEKKPPDIFKSIPKKKS